jgi:hypothetical protein
MNVLSSRSNNVNLLVSLLAFPSIMKVRAICSSETSDFLRTTRRYNTEEFTHVSCRWTNIHLLISWLALRLTMNIRRYVPPKRRTFSELHGFGTQKNVLSCRWTNDHLLVSWLASPSTTKIRAACFSETSDFLRTTRQYNTVQCTFYSHR